MRQVASGGPNFRHTNDTGAVRGRFHRLDERQNQLVKSNQAEAQSGLPGERKPLTYLVERQQSVGPAVSGAEHVPGLEDRGIEIPVLNHLLALGPHGDVVPSDRSRVGDAEIDEMMDAEFGANVNGFSGGVQINGAKFTGCGRSGMRRANQMDEGVGGADQLAVTIGVERISGDHFTFGGQLGF